MSRITSLLICALGAAAAGIPGPSALFASLVNDNGTLAAAPRTITVDGNRLLTAKAALAVGEPSTLAALESLLADADGWLGYGPWSVMDKNSTGPTGDKHDYYVQNAYFWPSENSTDGCPYLPRDGVANPAADKRDDESLVRVLESSWILALAWWYTGNATYAEHAGLVLRTWFLDEETRMNPNMNFGGSIPCLGLEENPYAFASLIGFSSRISFVTDAVRILEATGAPGWSPEETAAMTRWYSDMIGWLTTSYVGNQTLSGFNNHGLYALLAGVNMAMYVGDDALARDLLHKVPARIDEGIAANGSQPHELIRTQAFHYSMFTLVGYSRISMMGEKLCVDLWRYEGPEGQSIRKGIEFLIPPALEGLDVWPYPEPIHFRRAAPSDIFHYAAERGSEMARDALSSCGMEKPSLGDRWPIRPAPQELDATSIIRPSNPK